MAHLPQSFSRVLNTTIIDALNAPELQAACPAEFPADMFTFSADREPASRDTRVGRVITCVHAVWSHMGIAQLSQLSTLLRNEIRPMVKTRFQNIFCQ